MKWVALLLVLAACGDGGGPVVVGPLEGRWAGEYIVDTTATQAEMQLVHTDDQVSWHSHPRLRQGSYGERGGDREPNGGDLELYRPVRWPGEHGGESRGREPDRHLRVHRLRRHYERQLLSR